MGGGSDALRQYLKLRQYLYFCTSKARELRACVRWGVPGGEYRAWALWASAGCEARKEDALLVAPHNHQNDGLKVKEVCQTLQQ